LRLIGLFAVLITISSSSFAREGTENGGAQTQLGQLHLFVRGYKHIPNKPPVPTLQLYIDVKNGVKSAADACMELISSAAFYPNGANEGKLINDTPDTRRIVTNFNSLHRSFFSVDDMGGIPNFDCRQSNILIHDTTIGALAMTRTLFNSAVNFTEVFTGATPVEAVRSLGSAVVPTLLQAQTPGSSVEVPLANLLGVSRGELTGVVPMSAIPGRYNQVVNFKESTSALQIHSSIQNAGVLGSSSYIQINHGHLSPVFTDGAIKMPRRLSKNIFSDFLCRSVPVIQLSDAAIYVQSNSAIPFRTQASCMQCHASMDPMAAAWRAAKVIQAPQDGNCMNGTERTNHLVYLPVTKPDAPLQPVAADPDYYQRPAKWLFLYRDTDGVLHRVQGTGVAELSRVIMDLDDLYRCTAARYLKYFTGIDVSLFDPTDPGSPRRNPVDQEYFELVKSLGASFKTTKKLDTLIREIISSPLYGTASQRSQSDSVGVQNNE